MQKTYQTKWLRDIKGVEVRNGSFPDVIQNCEDDIDFAYAFTIEYVFDNEHYLNFFKSIIKFSIKDFLLTKLFIPLPSWKFYLKKLLAITGLTNRGQFWEYIRTIDEYLRVLKKAGFSSFEKWKYTHGSYWIRACIDRN